MNNNACKVVAEIGCVHAGCVDRAKKLIRLAKLAGADYVKFQKRNPIESVPKKWHDRPHPNVMFSYGKTYLEHRLALELNLKQHSELKQYCDEVGIGYSSSVWDATSAREIVSLKPDYIKLPSALNNDYALMQLLLDEFDGDLHLSTGMATEEELKALNDFLATPFSVRSRIVLYHCTSEYPCPFEHLYLQEIKSLGWYPVKEVGFSNHGYGIAADIVAYTLGATWIERHFVDDRTFRHTDASASLEPDGLRRLCRDLKAVRKASTAKKSMSEEEKKQRDKLRGTND